MHACTDKLTCTCGPAAHLAALQSNAQLDGAFEYLKRIGPGEVSIAELEESAGVGVMVTPEQIQAAVDGAIAAKKEQLLEER